MGPPIDPETRVNDIDVSAYRTPGVEGVDAQFPARWSPRAMAGERLEPSELRILFEAARWAPSSYNAQPWRFVYAERDAPGWPRLFDALIESNQGWAKNAGVLIAVLSRRRFAHNDQPAPTHSFDAGAAWMSLALQASKLRLVAHAMQGFDAPAARRALALPELYAIDAMVAVGRPSTVGSLPERLQAREVPSSRKPLAEIAQEVSAMALD